MADNPDWRTIIIAIILSIIVSTGIMNVPQLQDALRGPKGEPGPPGPPGPGLGELIHDSGWRVINPGNVLHICTLDDPAVFVYIIGRADDVRSPLGGVPVSGVYPSYKAHQKYYGGDRWELPLPKTSGSPPDLMMGVSWSVDMSNRLKVYRPDGDVYYEEVRVLVWQLPS